MKVIKKLTLHNMILALFLVVAQQAGAQPYRVQARLDTNRLLIGDQIRLHIELHQPETARVEFPVLEDELSGGVEVLEAFPRDTVSAGQPGSITINQQYLVTSFDTGAVSIPPFSFAYKKGDLTDSISTLPLSLYVESVSVDTTSGFFDIKGPFGAPLTFMEILPYLLGVVALALLTWGVMILLRKRRRQEPLIKPQKPSEPAHVYALRELDRLKKERLWQNDQVKSYYTRLSEILRTYLWMRYQVKTLERTTDEILFSLKNSDLDDQKAYDQLAENLRFADLVKFARFIPGPDENEAALDQAYEFVQTTRYVPEPAGEEDKDGQDRESVEQNDQQEK